MSEVRHRQIETNGIGMHLAETGPDDAPVVLCCHGFPESWYSWRHQLDALGDGGFHVIAPDMRGYGGTDATPTGTATMLHLLGDMVGVLDAVGASSATIVGHDWGGPVAWTCAQLRPDRFPAVVSLGAPFRRGKVAPTAGMRAAFAETWFYTLYFQEPGVAEAELDANPDTFLRDFFFTMSGDCDGDVMAALAGGPPDGNLLGHLTHPDRLPSWLTEDDLRFYVGEFERTGFAGGLNWYRSTDATWDLTRGFADLKVHQPALFIYGEREPAIAMFPSALKTMPVDVPGLVDITALPGCGHWTQQERPQEVNAALTTFLSRNA